MITEPTPEELNFAEQVDSILSRGNPQSGFAYRELALFLRPREEPLPRRGRFFTCTRHGWDALGTPCPDCIGGDAPHHCSKHGWSCRGTPCPKCAAGQ